jgi:hypothetical protein
MVLRLYSDFCANVVFNAEKAALLISEAERIEDQQTKDHQRESGVSDCRGCNCGCGGGGPAREWRK